MTAVIILIVIIVAFGGLVFTLIDRDALGWGAKPPRRAPQGMPTAPRPAAPRPTTSRSARPRSNDRDSLLTLLIIVSFLGVIYIGLTLGHVRNIGIGYASNAWPSVEGQILSSAIRLVKPRRSASYWQPTIRYRYRVDGREYVGERWRVYPNNTVDTPFARQFTTRYAPGTIVMVRYDPRDPTVAALEPGVVTRTDHLGAAAGWLVTVTLFFCTTLAIRELLKPDDLRGGLERAAFLRYQRDLLDDQRTPPRSVPLGAFLRAAYPPIDLALFLPFLALAWFFLTPVLGTPAEWLVALVAVTFAVPALWRLGRNRLRLLALRHGVLATAQVGYAGERAGYTYLEVSVWVQGVFFDARYRYTGPARTRIRSGEALEVLVNPSRQRVLLLLPPSKVWL